MDGIRDLAGSADVLFESHIWV